MGTIDQLAAGIHHALASGERGLTGGALAGGLAAAAAIAIIGGIAALVRRWVRRGDLHRHG